MYDAIIIGARCAGSPTAMLLARKGYRVLLLDRATFPSDTMSTHFLKRTGGALLKRWGLLDQVAASNCPPIDRMAFDWGGTRLVGSAPGVDGLNVDYAPRRIVLDKILVDAAVEAGVELREGFTVSELLTDGDRVTGIRGHTKNGTQITEKARIVIGADGLRSMVATTVGAPTYFEAPARTCAYYAYFSGMPKELGELYTLEKERRFIITFPTNDDLSMVFLFWPNSEVKSVRADMEGSFFKTLDMVPELSERVRAGRRETPFGGTHVIPNFFRKPWGPGWALAGDAAVHRDPITAQGISNAFHDAQLLSDALDAGFSGQQPLDEALDGYEQKRVAAMKPLYDYTTEAAKLEPFSPEKRQLLAALQGNQTEINRFIGAFIGSVPVAEFYAPENIERILREAGETRSVAPELV